MVLSYGHAIDNFIYIFYILKLMCDVCAEAQLLLDGWEINKGDGFCIARNVSWT